MGTGSGETEGHPVPDDVTEFEIDREKVAQYFYWYWFLLLLLVAVFTAGVGIAALGVYWLFVGPRLPKKQAAALGYRLEGKTLRIDQGVYWLKRKAIPMDRVTDVVLAQGPLLRRFDLWVIQVQTAGAVQQVAEGVLVGVREAEDARDLLLKVRDEAASRGNSPAT